MGQMDINQKDICCIENLYWNRTAQIRIDDDLTDTIDIYKGVRQGCVLSPLLFNMYSEMIFQAALEDINEGIKVNGTWINDIRNANDTAVIAEDMEDL